MSGDNEVPDEDDRGQQTLSANDVQSIVNSGIEKLSGQLQTELQNIKDSKSETPPARTYTREQLRAAVEAERITQIEADAIWDQQQDAKMTDTIKNTVTDFMTTSNVTQELQGKIDVYTGKFPNLLKEGSDERNKVEAEIREQCKILGVTKPTLAIEYQALRTLYGPETALKQVNTDAHDRDAGEDVHRPGSQELVVDKDGNMQLNQDGSPKGISADERKYYQDLIDKGIYRNGWPDVVEELKFSNPELRKRAAARG